MNLISFENTAIAMTNNSGQSILLSDINIKIKKKQVVHIVCTNLERRSLFNSLLRGDLTCDYEVSGSIKVRGKACLPTFNSKQWPNLRVSSVEVRRSSLRSSQLVVEQLISMLLNNQIIARSEALEKVTHGLLELGLSADVLNRYPHELCSSSRIKVQILQSLLQKPEILVVDGIEVLPSFEWQGLQKNLETFLSKNNMTLILWHNNSEQKPEGGETYFLDDLNDFGVLIPDRSRYQESLSWN